MGIFSKFEGRVEDTFEGAANKMFDSPISPVQIAKKAEKQMRREKMVGAGKQYAPTLYTILVNSEDDRRLFGYYPTLAGETETYLSAKANEEGLVMDGQPLVRFIVDEGLKRGKFDVIAELVSAPIISQLRAEEMDRYGISSSPAPSRQQAPAAARQQDRRPPQQHDLSGFEEHEVYDEYGTPTGYEMPPGQPAQAPTPAVRGPQAAAPQMAPAAFEEHTVYDEYGHPNGYVSQPGQVGKPPLPYVPEDEIDYSIDYGEYTFDSQDFEDYRDNGPAISAEYPGREGRFAGPPPAQAADFAGAAAAGVGAAAAAPVAGAPFGQPEPAYQDDALEAPNTVVFASGMGQAEPMPHPGKARARLMDTTTNRSYDLATARLLMGRENRNDIVVDDINASRTHAEIRLEPQGMWSISDLGSTNGTLVNGKEITSHILHDGDYVTIGMTNYIFMQS